jgi:hypothetical protein
MWEHSHKCWITRTLWGSPTFWEYSHIVEIRPQCGSTGTLWESTNIVVVLPDYGRTHAFGALDCLSRRLLRNPAQLGACDVTSCGLPSPHSLILVSDSVLRSPMSCSPIVSSDVLVVFAWPPRPMVSRWSPHGLPVVSRGLLLVSGSIPMFTSSVLFNLLFSMRFGLLSGFRSKFIRWPSTRTMLPNKAVIC